MTVGLGLSEFFVAYCKAHASLTCPFPSVAKDAGQPEQYHPSYGTITLSATLKLLVQNLFKIGTKEAIFQKLFIFTHVRAGDLTNLFRVC